LIAAHQAVSSANRPSANEDPAMTNGTVNGGLRIRVARSLADAVQADPLTRQYYGRPLQLRSLQLPAGAQTPARKYLDWHREKIFVD
jgi:hypothetical protein